MSNKEELIQSLSHSNLLKITENMLITSTMIWNNYKHIDTQKLQDCAITWSCLDFPLFNSVLTPNLPEKNVQERIAEINSIIGTPSLCWWISQNSKPNNLSQHLIDMGAKKIAETDIMGIELNNLMKCKQNDNLEIIEVNNGVLLMMWTEIIAASNSIPDSMKKYWNELYQSIGYGEDHPINRHFIALLDGIPVGACTLVTACGISSISNISAIYEYRNQGIGKALANHVLHIAKELGYKVACIYASGDGEPFFKKLGFNNHSKANIFMFTKAL